jgi:uncharacterized protein involved in exopolysaccharide biosynthesis
MDESIDLFEVLTLFIVEWRRFLLAAAVVFLIGTAMTYSITPLYEADASLLPQSKEDTSSLASDFSSHSPADVYLGLLASRSVQDDVIDREHLLDLYQTRSRQTARAILSSRSVFAVGRDTMVTVRVRDKRAEDATRITNAYLEALEAQREKMVQVEAELHNHFFEQQLAREANALADAEQELKNVQVSTGIVQPEAQTNLGLTAIETIRGRITDLQVQLSALLLSASEQNPAVQSLRAEISQLEAQEHTLESASGASHAGAAASVKQMPELNLEYARKLREVKFHEALFTSISNQFESAKLSGGYAGASFVVVDRAVIPETRAWPPRKLLLLLTLGFSVFAGLVAVGLTLAWRKLKADPAQRERILTIRKSFRLTR